jgi:hypothetical protein
MTRPLLLRDSTLLELQQALHHAPSLGQLIALGITDVTQELPDVVVALHSLPSSIFRDILAPPAP